VLRLFLLFNLLFINLYACSSSFNVCKKKLIDSNSVTSAEINIPVKKKKRLIFSLKTPSQKIIKHDPFLSLYLVEDKKGFRHPFSPTNYTSRKTACVSKTDIIKGKITSRQIGLNNFAKYSKNTPITSLLLTSCCDLKGFVTPEGIIEKTYLRRFINTKKVIYSDIGIRVKDENKFVIVEVKNTFFTNNSFEVGDCILTYDGKKVRNSADLMQWILFSKVGTTHFVKVKRGFKFLTLKMSSYERKGGGYLSDTFLESLGLYFDKNLNIVKISSNARKYGLKIGDNLLQINYKNIKNEKEMRKIFSVNRDFSILLFQRDNFQFFVTIKSI